MPMRRASGSAPRARSSRRQGSIVCAALPCGKRFTPKRAARSAPASLCAASQSGIPPGCAGLGNTGTPSIRKRLPWKRTGSPTSACFRICTASSVRDTRSACGMPNARNSCGA